MKNCIAFKVLGYIFFLLAVLLLIASVYTILFSRGSGFLDLSNVVHILLICVTLIFIIVGVIMVLAYRRCNK